MRRGERLAFVLVGHLLSGRRQAAAVCQCPLRAVASAAPRAVLEGRTAAAVAVASPVVSVDLAASAVPGAAHEDSWVSTCS